MPHGPERTDSTTKGKGAKAPAPDTFEGQVLSLLPSLRRYSRSLTRSDPDGEDLLQDCVEKVLVRRGQWQGLNLKAWMFTIMTNLHRNSRRYAIRHPVEDMDGTDEIAADTVVSDPLERHRLESALNDLAPESRAVLMLVVIEGYSYQEVATMLAIPVGTVMSRLSRARQRLSARLSADNIISLRRPR